MNDRFIILSRSIQEDLHNIAAIYDEMAAHSLHADSDDETLIVIGYHLHNLYNAFENIFQNISAVFENAVDDTEHWHARLLERMRLDAMPLRPAVIDEEAYAALDELRRFRHLFRHAYRIELDARRLQLVLEKAMVLKDIYRPQIQKVLDFLEHTAQ